MSTKKTAVNVLEYTGVVTLSQYIGSKKIQIAKVQNEGSYSLFNFFADCLIGDYDIAKTNRPTKIMLLLKDSGNNYSSASGFIYQTSKPEKVFTNTMGTVRYKFIVQKDLLSRISSETVYIGLYANSATENEIDDFSALVSYNFDKENASVSSAILVDWELNISNKNKEIV